MNKFLVPFLMVCISCDGQAILSRQHGDFYFPLKKFFTETTYCFVNQNDKLEKSYWKMKAIISNKDTFLQTSIFDSKDSITETMTEQVVNGYSKIVSYTLFNYDKNGNKLSSPCNVLDSLVFTTSQKVGEQIQWKVSFKEYATSNICELSKIRKLQNQNNVHQTYADYIKFVITDTKQGYEYFMTSIYQKNKGLVSYKLILPNGKVKNFILTNIKW